MLASHFRSACAAGAMLAAAGLALASPASAGEPSLPTTQNGFYLMQGDPADLSEYVAADAICFDEPTGEFAGVRNVGKGAAEFLMLNRDGKLSRDRLIIDGPDAGVSQRRYALNDPESGAVVVALNYINLGALGDPAKIPMVGLSSVSIPLFGDKKSRCMLSDNIVYIGTDRSRTMVITADPDAGLTLHQTSLNEPRVKSELSGGYWSSGPAHEVIFSFIEGSRLTSIKAAGHSPIAYPAWRVADRFTRQFSSSPQGFFLADMARLGSNINKLPYDLAVHFERLEICQHLAGEASGNAGRDAQLAQSWSKAGCGKAKAQQAVFRRQYSDNKNISALLKAHTIEF